MYVLVAATATAVVAAATAVVAAAVVAAAVVKAAAENEQQYDDPPNVVIATAVVAAVVTAAATTIIAPAEDQQEDYDPPPMLCTVVILLYRLRQPGENLNLKILRIGAKPANGAGILHAGQHHAQRVVFFLCCRVSEVGIQDGMDGGHNLAGGGIYTHGFGYCRLCVGYCCL